MARITAVLNQKGGTGKTSTAHALATGLNLRGFKALAIDADAQGNLTDTMQADPTAAGLYEIMRGEATAAEAIQHTEQGDIIASSLALAAADMEFTRTGREYLIREALEAISEDYTHIVIDAPPALGIMSVNALTAATDVVIPMNADVYSLQGLSQLLGTIGSVRKYSNPALDVAGILLTRKGGRAIATRAMLDQITEAARRTGLHLYGASIREGVAVREAQIMRTSIFTHAPKAKVTQDYSDFIDEYTDQRR